LKLTGGRLIPECSINASRRLAPRQRRPLSQQRIDSLSLTPSARPGGRKDIPLAENAAGAKPIRVAIVGGGCAGIAAAWQLSRRPGYEIHVYESSWRLGGKGASVRAGDGRVLEHGLHVWLGCYENAFRMMRECYAEVEDCQWGPDSSEKLAHGRIDDAFFPEPHIGLGRPDPHRDWAVWSAYLPPAKGLPGQPLDEHTNPFTLASYLLRCFDLLKALMLSVIGAPGKDAPGEPRPDDRSMSDETLNFDFSVDGTTSLKLAIERTAQLVRAGSLTGAAALLQAVTILEVWLQDLNFGSQAGDSIVELAEALAAQTRKLLQDFVRIDPDIRVKTEIIDLVMTIAVGLFRDRVLFDDRGLDSLNQFDYREWLRLHGATQQCLDSRLLRGIYDFAFAYSRGDRNRPALAAGVALRGALRMFFTYRGSMFWRVRSGMGDAVFAPLYKVLSSPKRKMNGKDLSVVRFHFRHELANVGVVALNGKRLASSLEFKTQGDERTLDRLSKKALDEFGCWPDGPVAFANAKGVQVRKLQLGEDFDRVILAIGIDDFRKACPAASSKDNLASILGAQWPAMCANVRTVATQSAQVWLGTDLDGLGWHRGSGLITALGLSFDSFDTWADMTHVLGAEAWRAKMEGRPAGKARSLAYFCAPLRDSEIDLARERARRTLDAFAERVGAVGAAGLDDLMLEAIKAAAPQEKQQWIELSEGIRTEFNELASALASTSSDEQNAARARFKANLVKSAMESGVDENLTQLLQQGMRPVWPRAFAKDATAEQDANAEQLVLHRHVQANFEGSDRYTLSEPGLIGHRVSPLDRSVENMTIAGDWTACGLDVGCVEAAVMSGMLASHAISGKPDLAEIVGYDHP
jgi:uncharacterized protein with NAD-binding domain and iron-sulfur cluster